MMDRPPRTQGQQTRSSRVGPPFMRLGPSLDDRLTCSPECKGYEMPPGHALGVYNPTPNPSASVADGVWALLSPLAEGAHTIGFRGVALFPPFRFEQNVTYHVTVVPPQFQ